MQGRFDFVKSPKSNPPLKRVGWTSQKVQGPTPPFWGVPWKSQNVQGPWGGGPGTGGGVLQSDARISCLLADRRPTTPFLKGSVRGFYTPLLRTRRSWQSWARLASSRGARSGADSCRTSAPTWTRCRCHSSTTWRLEKTRFLCVPVAFRRDRKSTSRTS